MCIESERAAEYFRKACRALEEGQNDLAEIFYLQSMNRFEKAGTGYRVQAANSLNALAFLRRSRGDHEGALRSAQQSLQIMKQYPFKSTEADLIRNTAWSLIELVHSELALA